MAIKDLLKIGFIKDAGIQLAVTVPWILFFIILQKSPEISACEPKTILRLEFALNYNIIATLLILVVAGVKYHAHWLNIDTSKQFGVSKGVIILQVIQYMIASVVLFGLYGALEFQCPSSIQDAITFYLVAQVAIMVILFLRFVASFFPEKENKKEEKEDLLKKEQRENTLKKGKAK